MGIGDLLRSSAAWRALKDRWPDAELHLLFLSKHPGYATEELIKAHHLLSSATFLTTREGSPHISKAKKVPYRVLRDQIQDISKHLKPDLIIDFEASGLRSTLLARAAKAVCTGLTVGISQFPGRGLLYDLAAEKTSIFAQRRGLTLPMDYTNRDFVALAALGIEREGRPIELELSNSGKHYADQLKIRLPSGLPVIGMNIGCGTPDALHKRPNMIDLVECVGAALHNHPHCLILSGAKFEDDVNIEFIEAYSNRWGSVSHIYNLAGETNLCSLVGLIDICDIFISTDSGPYHMAVAMKKPTLVWFTYPEVTSFHENSWCRRLINPTPDQFNSVFNELFKFI
jgi:ADP-heptose:LPS heptosyltransferase